MTMAAITAPATATALSAWGWGGNGQLGHGDRDTRIKPQAVRALLAREPLATVVCGSRFTVALTATGVMFAWGKNDYGQLGTGDTKAQIEPRRIDAPPMTAVAARGAHVLALTASGELYSWGRGDEGQLGHGQRESLTLPVRVTALQHQRVRLIAAGRSHSVAVTEDGAVYTWGSNEDGALGRPCGIQLDEDGDKDTPHDGGDGGQQQQQQQQQDGSDAVPRRVGGALRDATVTQLACGSRHVLVLTADDRVLAWGWGLYGQLGLGGTASCVVPTELSALRGKHVRQICCGFRHSFAVLPRRRMRRVSSSSLRELRTPSVGASQVDVWAWGWNAYGQLGEHTPSSYVVKPMPISTLSNVDLLLLAAGGRHSLCQIRMPAADDGASVELVTRARSATDSHLRVRGAFETLAWGRGSDGELGIGAVTSSSLPVNVPAFQSRPLVQLCCGWAHSTALSTDAPLGSDQEQQEQSTWAAFAVSIGDIDAFFGLLVQFIIQILLIFQLLPVRCGLSVDVVTQRIIPAAAMTVTIGNTFFGLLAATLARKEARADVTALPEGINTVLVFAYGLSIMAPEYDRTHSAEQAWEVGLFAAFMTGLLQILCLPFVKLMRRCIPRAALLASVAGVALAFLSMGFAFQVWENPMVALSPLMLVLICLGAGVKLPFHVPTGLGALLLGTCSAFVLYVNDYPMTFTPFSQPYEFEINLLRPDVSVFTRAMTSGAGWKYLSVIAPMVLVNVMSTLANLETAVAVGENFDPTLTILGDSVASMIGAVFGNPFPANIYIGQPIYKSMGARVSYVLLTAVAVMLIAVLNATTLIVNTVPISCGVGFLLWIGLVISASSFNQTPSSNTNHGTAVALGMVPAFAAWAFQLVQNAIVATWSTAAGLQGSALPLQAVLDALTVAGVNPTGMIALSQGYLLTSIMLASMMVNIIEREFLRASAWMCVAALLSAVGAVHSFEVDGDVVKSAFGLLPGGLEGWAARYAAAYLGVALLLLLFHVKEGEISVALPLRHAMHSVTKRVRLQWVRATNHRSAQGDSNAADDSEKQPLLR